MEPQDAYVVRGSTLQLIAGFKPFSSDAFFGVMVYYEWLFQSANGGSQIVMKSGIWRGGTSFVMLRQTCVTRFSVPAKVGGEL